VGIIFKTMFPDSSIASQFSCGDKKAAYLSTFGIAPYLQDNLTEKLHSKSSFVILFDETLNKYLQEHQMDFYVRFWDNNRVQTSFFESFFLGHTRAEDLLPKFVSFTEKFSQRKILQISMDGPNVNWKVHNSLQRDIELSTGGVKMLEIGSCGLHVLHNAFQRGHAASHWEIENFLSSLYRLFHDSPARRDDFTNLAGGVSFPLKFCKCRWLENAAPAERAVELLPHAVAYCSEVKKQKKEPSCQSYKVILSMLGDPLIKAKLQFYAAVARQMEPFLQKYQTDAPMLPFLATDLSHLVRELLRRFVKDEILRDCSSPLSLTTVKYADRKNQVDPSKIDIGFCANLSLRSLKVSDKAKMTFRMECRDFLVATLEKIFEKAPIKYQLVRSLSWLDPRLMVNPDFVATTGPKQMEITLRRLCEAGRTKATDCDEAKRQYRTLCDKVNQTDSQPFRMFDPKENRLDELLAERLCGRKEYAVLWSVVEQILILSHGQATVERGFTVNRETIVENLKKRSLVGRRLILDAVRKAGGPTKLPITKELLTYCSSARKKYQDYLDEERSNKEKEKASAKRKAAKQDIDDLKAKRKCLEKDRDHLEKSANQKAEEAEKKMNLPLLTESNALRRRAREKAEEMKKLDKQIKEKEEEDAS
jgi:hypothetical protein